MFGNRDVPAKISRLKLSKWYSALDDRNKVRLGRYIDEADTSSKYDFTISIMTLAEKDENYALVPEMCKLADTLGLNDAQSFVVNEHLVDALYHTKAYDECLQACEVGLKMIPKIRVDPETDVIKCRNHKLNVLVGVKNDYAAGEAALREFNAMGILSDEDLGYRLQSLKVHRLQRTFDGVFSATKL